MFKYLILAFVLIYRTLCAEPILQRYESLFSQLPEWDIETAQLQPFGNGCTNKNYLLQLGTSRYFVRMGSHSKEVLGLSIARELQMMRLAAKLELAPPVFLADREVIICPFIASKPVNLHDKENLAQAIALLKRFHESGEKIPFTVTPEDIIHFYLSQIKDLKIALTSKQEALIAERPRPIISTLVPCHMDLKGENLLDDGTRLWLIDWEYGGLSDPLFDLATLAPAEGFSEDELSAALELYHPKPTAKERLRLKQFTVLANLRIALWCLIMSRTSNLDHPYQQWADELFDLIETQLKTSAF